MRELKTFTDTTSYSNRVIDFLLLCEADNNLLFGILEKIVINPHCYGEIGPNLFTVEDDGKIELVAFQTPPYNLVISQVDDLETVDLLANELYKINDKLPGVVGVKGVSSRFANRWKERSGADYKIAMNERIYQLTGVDHSGMDRFELLQADEIKHQALVVNWSMQFHQEAIGDIPGGNELFKKQIISDIKNGKIYLLRDGDLIVSMAKYSGNTPNGGLLNLVYTPIQYRKNGYASECVAKVSQKILDGGKDRCFLFTDLANPTSNGIYQKMGYKAVCDVDMYSFIY